MRYFVETSYDGTDFIGWQIQSSGRSVQETLQQALSTALQEPVEVVGCGRTDAGVHAKGYVFHMDTQGALPANFLHKLNRMLPPDIGLQAVREVSDDMHARFSALSRGYVYRISFEKAPLERRYSYYLPQGRKLDWNAIEEATAVITSFEEFKPFCKTGSDVTNYRCTNLRVWIGNLNERPGNLQHQCKPLLEGDGASDRRYSSACWQGRPGS